MTRNGLAWVSVVVGGVVFLVGFATSIVFVLQPWRTCSYEDTSAGCAMLVEDARVMSAAMITAIVGIVIAMMGIVMRSIPKPGQSR
jgi:hypothetical protein